MVIPIISSAFRFRLKWVLFFIALAGLLTLAGVLLVNDADDIGGLHELFEASTDVLIYFVVGIVVWMMSENLRHDSQEIRQHYDKLQTMQARLAKDQRLAAVGRLASAIAHEIRNPVAAIASSLAAADDQSMPADLRSEMSRIAAKEAGRLEKLTSDFLTYARVRPLVLRPTDVADAMKYIAGLVTAKAAESSVMVRTSCGAEIRATMDEFQIHGALLNLAINAIEASPWGSSVEIGVHLGNLDSAVQMYVESAGEAIPPVTVDQILEPFFTTKVSGTGLGLAIARNVAVAHGGTLELTDNRSGHVRFTLTVPLRIDESVEDSTPDSVPMRSAGFEPASVRQLVSMEKS
jgi:signal transduction histidine kinase